MPAGRNNAASASQHWCTPAEYVAAIRRFFDGAISLDPCSNPYSLVDASVEYCLPDADGLAASWDHPTVFCNPPYGRDRERGTTIRDWLSRCAAAHAEHSSEVLALIPVATNTRHWKYHIFGVATAAAFLYDTRLRFGGAGIARSKGAPMACAMVYWGADYDRFETHFLRYGAVVDLRHLHGTTIGRDSGPGEARAVRPRASTR